MWTGRRGWRSRPQQRGHGAMPRTQHATFQLLLGSEAISATHWSFAHLMPVTLLSGESSSGTVVSQMLGSGENHATRSLFLKTKIGARQVGRRDDAKAFTATLFSWGSGRWGQVQEKVTQREALCSSGAIFRKQSTLHSTLVAKNNLGPLTKSRRLKHRTCGPSSRLSGSAMGWHE